jgi:hypothetical protein
VRSYRAGHLGGGNAQTVIIEWLKQTLTESGRAYGLLVDVSDRHPEPEAKALLLCDDDVSLSRSAHDAQ